MICAALLQRACGHDLTVEPIRQHGQRDRHVVRERCLGGDGAVAGQVGHELLAELGRTARVSPAATFRQTVAQGGLLARLGLGFLGRHHPAHDLEHARLRGHDRAELGLVVAARVQARGVECADLRTHPVARRVDLDDALIVFVVRLVGQRLVVGFQLIELGLQRLTLRLRFLGLGQVLLGRLAELPAFLIAHRLEDLDPRPAFGAQLVRRLGQHLGDDQRPPGRRRLDRSSDVNRSRFASLPPLAL